MSRMICSLVLIATVSLAIPLAAQTTEEIYTSPPQGTPGIVYTPEIQLGSADRPAIVTEPPVIEEIPGLPLPPPESNVTPSSTALLSTRHFDYITSPMDVIFGSMEDTAVSLGEYARKLREEKKNSPTPNAIGNPTEPE